MNRDKITNLFESEIERAEIVLAIKDITDSLQKMASDLSRKSYDDLPYIVERIKASYGIKAGNTMEELIKQKLDEVANSLIDAKSEIDNKALVLSGDAASPDMEVTDMESDEGFDEPEEVDVDVDIDDEKDMPDIESDDELPLGRAMKEGVFKNLKSIVKENKSKHVVFEKKNSLLISPTVARSILEGYKYGNKRVKSIISEAIKTKDGFKKVRNILRKN